MELLRLLRVEARLLLGRGVVRLLLLLPILPPLLSLALHARYARVFETLQSLGFNTGKLWLVFLGSTAAMDSELMKYAAGLVSGLTIANLASFAWLVSVLFAALGFASDVSSGRLSLVLVRPYSRGMVVASKVAASFLLLALLYLEAAASAYASAWILVGRQEQPWLIPVYAVLLAFASLPLLIVTALIGLKTGRTGSTFAGGIIVYLALNMVPAIVAVLVAGSISHTLTLLSYISALEPIHSFILPRLALDAAVAGLESPYNPAGMGQGPQLGTLLSISAVSTAAYTIALLALLVWYASRMDLKVP